MVDKINDGGPAFPIPDERDPDGNGLYQGSRGMTLRDWFAGQALAGYLASARYPADCAPPAGMPADRFASLAYEFADHMLAARERGR